MKRLRNLVLLCSFGLLVQDGRSQNLLDLSTWLPGTGGTTFFQKNGDDNENAREWGTGPAGNRVILWKATPVSGAGLDGDGGWMSTKINVNAKAMYRYTVWVRKENSSTGYTYLGCSGTVNRLDGTPENNPYFFNSQLPELNKWYLIVGYVHGSDDNTTSNWGGVYDGITGAKVMNCTDFKFPAAQTQTQHRAFLFYDANTQDRQYMYSPRIELVNGNEPSVAALLGTFNNSVAGATNFSGKVGILTNDPGDYALAVKGKVRAQEIKVDAPANWPDYVFEKAYMKMTLEDLEAFIDEYKRLLGVPAATEMKEQGLELAAMNKLLLEKIEELTLYLIEVGKSVQDLTKRSASPVDTKSIKEK